MMTCLRFSPQKRTPVDWGSYDESLVEAEQTVSSSGATFVCSSYLQVSSDGHVESSPGGMGQKQFLSQSRL